MSDSLENLKGDPVLITTDSNRKGVFSGILEDFGYDPQGKLEVKLKDARNVHEWTADVKGVFGLASDGPTNECSISEGCEEMFLNGVTSVTLISDGAWEKHEKSPWNV